MQRLLIVLTFFLPLLLTGQTFPGQEEFSWPDNFVNYKQVPDSLSKEDVVILSETVGISEVNVVKRVAIKILTKKGAEAFKTYQLPENFDITNCPNYKRQGRFKSRKAPFIYDYKIEYFAARIITPNKKIHNIPLKYKAEEIYWVSGAGKRVKDFLYNFDLETVSEGDILEVIYKAIVDWNYDQAPVYPQSAYPKLNYNLTVLTQAPAFYKEIELIYNTNIPTSVFKMNAEFKIPYYLRTYKYHYDYLKGVTYPFNCMAGVNLPHVSINHSFFWAPSSTSPNSLNQDYKPLDVYKWSIIVDTVNVVLHDKYHTNLRKFLACFPDDVTDSTGNKFVCKLFDTLNSFTYISTEDIKNGEYAQYSTSSSEHLLKRKFSGEFGLKNYGDCLAERKIFFYNGILIDRRYGGIVSEYRTHSNLEQRIIVVPEKKSFKFYVPRFDGLKYYPDEMPFYFEGIKCALKPCMNCEGNEKSRNLLFITTPKTNSNQNARIENGSFKVITDSMIIKAGIKENLSGQFSTILRPYYSNQPIDSSIVPYYFKKCSDKPLAKEITVKQTSTSRLFPFKHSFICNEVISMPSKNQVDLKNWFSFLWNKDLFPRVSNHDYVMDFMYSDLYNFLFEFDKPTEITNSQDLNKNLANDYFEIQSSLTKQEDSKYLLSVIVRAKQPVIPEKDGIKIVEFASMLDEINNFKLQLKN